MNPFFSFVLTCTHNNVLLYSRVRKKNNFYKIDFFFSPNLRFYLLVFLTLYHPIKIFLLFPGVDSYWKKKCRTFYLFNNSTYLWDRIGIFQDTNSSRVWSRRSLHKRIRMISIGKMHKPLWPEQQKNRYSHVKRSLVQNVEWHLSIRLFTTESYYLYILRPDHNYYCVCIKLL